MKHTPRFLAIVDAAKQHVRETDVASLRRRIEQEDDVHILDVREDHEWAHGHLPRAIHLGKGILERDIEKVIPDTDTEIVLYCGGGYRSALAADALQRMGYTNVWSLAGGYRAWTAADQPIEGDTAV